MVPDVASLTVPAVPGATSAPVAPSMAFQLAEPADRSVALSAPLLSVMMLISPLLTRAPMLHSQMFPQSESMPLGLLSWFHEFGPEPVMMRALPDAVPGARPSTRRPDSQVRSLDAP